MQPTLTDLLPEYAADWATMSIDRDRTRAVDRAVDGILDGRARYALVEAETRVPWFVVGLLHMRESSGDFSTHLHNGDPLGARTVHVPAGRPRDGRPPYGWAESAIDALRYDRLDRVGSWPVEAIAYHAEAYNGFGPRRLGRKSGYLWAGSSIYDGGKYVADGVWDPAARDRQLGVMTVLRALAARAGAGVGATLTSVGSALRARTPEDLQRALNVILADDPEFRPLLVDGSVGRLTRDAVRRFQARVGLASDGVVGPLTWAALDRALAKTP